VLLGDGNLPTADEESDGEHNKRDALAVPEEPPKEPESVEAPNCGQCQKDYDYCMKQCGGKSGCDQYCRCLITFGTKDVRRHYFRHFHEPLY
jgi:hypothetical protein